MPSGMDHGEGWAPQQTKQRHIDSMTPGYAPALGSSGDRPAALADLIGGVGRRPPRDLRAGRPAGEVGAPCPLKTVLARGRKTRYEPPSAESKHCTANIALAPHSPHEVDDLDAIAARVIGLEVLVPMRVTFYGMRELWVIDPAGYVHGFAQSVATRE